MSIVISGTYKSCGKAYYRNYNIDLKQLGLGSRSWTGLILKEMARLSMIESLDNSQVSSFMSVLSYVLETEVCGLILRKQPQAITKVELLRLYEGVDRCIVESGRWPLAPAKASGNFRNNLLRYSDKASFSTYIDPYSVNFRSTLSDGRRPRSLLSEDVDHTYAAPYSSPIGAMPHSSIVELRSNQKERLQRDIDKYLSAFKSELLFWQNVRRKSRALSELIFSEQEISNVTVILGGEYKKAKIDYRGMSAERFFGCAAMLSIKKDLASKIGNQCLRTEQVKTSMKQIFALEEKHIAGVMPAVIVFIVQRINARELVAAFCVLLFWTAWNSDTLREIQIDWIVKVPGGYEISSHKSKVNRNAPTCFLDGENKGAILAVELLLWNHSQMKRLGLISDDEKRIWFTWSTRAYPMKHCITTMSTSLNAICSLHLLPRCTLDQIRTQVIVTSKFNTNSVELPRAIAAHSSLGTTGHYLDQLICLNTDKAVNLEFQRRLDHSIIESLNEENSDFPRKSDSAFVDKRFLFNVGDGTSCVNPEAPPKLEWLMANGRCNAGNCHVGGGCENNEIVLNPDRIEEAFRLHRFYRKNWSGLREKNIDDFEKNHVTIMLFNLALVLYIKDAPYWPKVMEILSKRGMLD